MERRQCRCPMNRTITNKIKKGEMEKSKDIEQGNKLIAEFMGCYGSTVYWGGEPFLRWGFKDTHITSRWPVNCFEVETPYHSSWSLLMAVVEKIENDCLATVNISMKTCIIKCNDDMGNKVARFTLSKIEAVWKCVIAYIEWYKIFHPDSVNNTNSKEGSNHE